MGYLEDIQSRISFSGDLTPVFKRVCEQYQLGGYQAHEVILSGYEDFNVVLVASDDKFFVKIFASIRSNEECARYVEIVKRVLDAGVSHPQLYEMHDGFLYTDPESDVRLVVMKYIDGETFFEHDLKPNESEVKEITRQAALVNRIDFKPTFIRDSWAITSFKEEYKKIREELSNEDRLMIEPLLARYDECHKDLPHAFVHGDLIKTNVMRAQDGKIFFIDFSVSNYYPRIYELTWLFSNMFFDLENDMFYEKNFILALSEYQKQIKLTDRELEVLPYFIKVAHAMHVIGATRERVTSGNQSAENDYWLKQGRAGLRLMNGL